MKMTPGQILVDMLDKVMAGDDPSKLNKALQKATCERFSSHGTTVTCGEYESSDGGPVKKRQ